MIRLQTLAWPSDVTSTMPGLPKITAADSDVSLHEAFSALRQAAHRLPTDGESLRKVLTDARLAWAILYGDTLLSGDTHDVRLREFDAVLTEAIGHLEHAEVESQAGVSKDAVGDRLKFYRRLVHLLQTEGLCRVAEEIQLNFGVAAAQDPGSSRNI